jgi:uncharacterized membrane protein
MFEVEKIFLLFFIYSVIGWAWETVYEGIKQKHFVYRGFLIGPYCPIYGFAVIGVVYLLRPIHGSIVILYITSAILATILEYFTSYFLEKFFHTTWWDYHDMPLNFQGRIALPVSLFWGVGCVLIIKVVNPEVTTFVGDLQAKYGGVLPFIIYSILLIDGTITLTNLVNFKAIAGKWSELLEVEKAKVSKKLEQLGTGKQTLQEVIHHKNWLDETIKDKRFIDKLPKFNFVQRRFLTNFDHLKLGKLPNVPDIRETFKRIRNSHDKKK